MRRLPGQCLYEWGPDFPRDAIRKEAVQAVLAKVEQAGGPYRPGLITLRDHLDSPVIPLGLAASTLHAAGIRLVFIKDLLEPATGYTRHGLAPL
jgi:hypothetical protein